MNCLSRFFLIASIPCKKSLFSNIGNPGDFLISKIHFLISEIRFTISKNHFPISKIYFQIYENHLPVVEIHFWISEIHFPILENHFQISENQINRYRKIILTLHQLNLLRESHFQNINTPQIYLRCDVIYS